MVRGNGDNEGGAGNDIIFCEVGNDNVAGGDGEDHVYGGRGNDRYSGGLGVDVAVFEGKLENFFIQFKTLEVRWSVIDRRTGAESQGINSIDSLIELAIFVDENRNKETLSLEPLVSYEIKAGETPETIEIGQDYILSHLIQSRAGFASSISTDLGSYSLDRKDSILELSLPNISL
ncbi:MAG: hypothetical protein K1X44_05070 [Alphaproteobacteria bacterium]|nr:hypothetical protein [Alphaproteobacteria bacterium]